MNGEWSVLICGVGGQGIVLFSRVLGTSCASSGVNVVTGEQHGLSQRSGTVSIHFRTGPGISSPLIPAGTAECLAGLEALEALRYIEYLKPGGSVFTSTLVMHPVTRTAEREKDPSVAFATADDVVSRLKTLAGEVTALDARSIAVRSGNIQSENMVMLGALSSAGGFPVTAEAVEASIAELVPSAADVNIEAFRAGRAHSSRTPAGS